MSYDVIVIGGGPGGYVAAIKCAQGKKKVLLAEDLAETIHAHPSVSEIYAEAAFHFIGKGLHS